MVNSKFWAHHFAMIVLTFTFLGSCVSDHEKQTYNEDKGSTEEVIVEEAPAVEVQVVEAYIDTFLPEMTVNNSLRINDPKTSSTFFAGKDDVVLVNFLRSSPVVVASNKDTTEYLVLYQYEGSSSMDFSYIEITPTIEQVENIVVLSVDHFFTENGLRLGTSYEELVSIKGSPMDVVKDSVTYLLDDYTNSTFLQQYNMPLYELVCNLQEGRIVRMKYGFAYP